MSWHYRVLALCGLAAVSLAWNSGSSEYEDDGFTQPKVGNVTGKLTESTLYTTPTFKAFDKTDIS